MLWYSFKGFLLYMNNLYSKNLSDKTKLGMERMNDIIVKKGYYISKKTGKKIMARGRPVGSKDKKQRSKKGYFLKAREKLPFLEVK